MPKKGALMESDGRETTHFVIAVLSTTWSVTADKIHSIPKQKCSTQQLTSAYTSTMTIKTYDFLNCYIVKNQIN
uniref:Uncharacterized protein n=1 Tax=Anguilla anguilla TaxID=7936 RepID=A0A0E9WNT9_ANGAN